MIDIIFDSSSVFARAWYATINTEGGSPHKAISAALHTVLSLLRGNDKLDERPDRILFAWDGNSKRNKGRAPKPLEFYEARELFKEALTVLLSAAHGYDETHEADDVVGTVVTNSKAETVYVVSGDKDLQQLQGNSIPGKTVRYYCLNNKMLLSSRWICSRFGIKHPSQAAISMAVTGDSCDGIKGIRGWGPAKSKKLFSVVTETMDFSEAFDAVVKQIPQGPMMDSFMESIELTLLACDLPGLPEPSEIKVASVDVAKKLEMPDIMHTYADVARNYGRKVVRKVFDEDGDEEDAPQSLPKSSMSTTCPANL